MSFYVDNTRMIGLKKGDRVTVLENDNSLEWPFRVEFQGHPEQAAVSAWVSASKVEIPDDPPQKGQPPRRASEPVGGPAHDGWHYASSVQES